MEKVMKKIIVKKIISLLSCLAILFTLVPAVFAAIGNTDLNFILMTESYAFNERVVAAVIDLGEGNAADGSALTTTMFTVNARAVREGTTTQAYNGARTIIDVYANETNTWKTDTTINNQWAPPSTRGDGRYIVIKFKDWDGGGENPDNGAMTAAGQSLTQTYTITLINDIVLSGGGTISAASFIQGVTTGLIEDEFIASSITGNGQTTLYSYYLNTEADGPLPLVIHFHGAQQGAHAKSPLRYSNNGTVWAYPENQEKYPCHVLAPSNGNAYTANWTAGHILNTGTIVNQMIADGLVDPNRIYVTGYSMGGTGTMQFMAEFPELVAAAVPICIASPTYAALNATNATKYKDVPVWAFVNRGDSASIVNGMNTFFTTGPGATILTNARYSVINNNETFIYPYVWTDYVGWDKTKYPTDAPNGVWDFGAHCAWIPTLNNRLEDMAFQNQADFDYASANGYEYVSDWMFSFGAPPVEKTDLSALIDEADGLVETDYTAESWSDLAAALAQARIMLIAKWATQAKTDAAAEDLQDAMTALVKLNTAYIYITGPDVVASGGGATATYTISAHYMPTVSGIELEFEVDGAYLASKSFAGLSGLSFFGEGNYDTDIYWRKGVGDVWIGKLTLLNLGTAVISGDIDILELVFNVRESVLGESGLKINYVKAAFANNQIGIEYINDEFVTEFTKYYSPFDLNKDGIIDLNDLTFALQYMTKTVNDPEWVDAYVCDVAPNGVIDIDDLVLILANYTIPYYS